MQVELLLRQVKQFRVTKTTKCKDCGSFFNGKGSGWICFYKLGEIQVNRFICGCVQNIPLKITSNVPDTVPTASLHNEEEKKL